MASPVDSNILSSNLLFRTDQFDIWNAMFPIVALAVRGGGSGGGGRERHFTPVFENKVVYEEGFQAFCTISSAIFITWLEAKWYRKIAFVTLNVGDKVGKLRLTELPAFSLSVGCRYITRGNVISPIISLLDELWH